MDLERLREYLIQRGVPAEKLDKFEESPVIRDIGVGLTLSLQNDDQIGFDVVMLMMRIDELEQRIANLEGSNA
jgi:hypothetical protein